MLYTSGLRRLHQATDKRFVRRQLKCLLCEVYEEMQNSKEKRNIIRRSKLIIIAIFCMTIFLILACLISKVGFLTSPRVWGVLYQENLKYGQYISIYHVMIDKKESAITFIYVINNKICTIQDYDGIRETFNDYLETHPDSFLNDEYSIEIEIIGTKSGGPGIVQFSNIRSNENDDVLLYDEISDMTITQEAVNCNKISQITGCDTLRSLHLSNVELDDLESLRKLPSLEYIELRFGYTKTDVLAVRAALPDCVVN